MPTPYTAYARETSPTVIEYIIWISGFAKPAGLRVTTIKAVRDVARGWVDVNGYHGAHNLTGLREAKDFVESIIAALTTGADTSNFCIAMPKEDENMHEALIATVLCHLRVPFTLERKP